MSRTTYRLFSSSLRSARVNLNAAVRSPRAAFTQRMMSTESHSGHGSAPNDRPWIIGSALVFGPLFLYLVSPSARQSSHEHTDHGHKSHRDEHDKADQYVESPRQEDVRPIADDEGTEVSGQEVKESMERAFETDSPKDAREREEVVAKADMTTVQDNSITEAHLEAKSLTDATLIPESEPTPTPAAPPDVDDASNETSDERVQGTTGGTRELTAESRA